MRTTDEYSLFVQDIIEEQNNNIDEEEIILQESDIYKDLRVCGYDYGPFFKRLKNIRTKDFRKFNGIIEWDGNWVTFMDGLLQTMAVTLAYRKLMVPVMIKRLVCDPKVFYEALARHQPQENQPQQRDKDEWSELQDQKMNEWDESGDEMTALMHSENLQYLDKVISNRFSFITKSSMPFHIDLDSKMIVTYGLEVECVEGIPIPRKSNVQDLRLESYEFVANHESVAMEESEKDRVDQYLKVSLVIDSLFRKVLISCLKACTEFADLLKNMIETKTNNIVSRMSGQLKKFVEDIKDDQILLKLLNECYKGLSADPENLNDSGKFMTEIQKKPEFDLTKDLINQVSSNEQIIRTLLDIVSENNVPKKEIKLFEINLTNAMMAKEIDNHMASAAIYPIDVSYGVAVKSMDNIGDSYKNKSFKFSEWNPNDSTFPSDVFGKDLIIIRDSPELWTLNLDSFVEEACDAVIDRGFVLTLFKYKYTEPELALNSMNGKKVLNDSELEQRINEFVKSAEKTGLKTVGYKCDSICFKAFLFRKVQSQKIPSKDKIIEIKSNSNEWFDKLKEKLEVIRENEDNDQVVWLLANDSPLNGIIGLINCLRLEPGGESIRCLFDCDQLLKIPNDLNQMPFVDIFKNDLAINVIKNGKIGSYRHLVLPHGFDKIESDQYYLNTGQMRDLSALQLFDLKNFKYGDVVHNISNNKLIKLIPCDIYVCGLNFRDVMLATGLSNNNCKSIIN